MLRKMNTRTIAIEPQEDFAARIEAREGEGLAQKIENRIAERLAAEALQDVDRIAHVSPQHIAALERDAEAALASGIASSTAASDVFTKFGVKWAGV
jgi:hypothetical protein